MLIQTLSSLFDQYFLLINGIYSMLNVQSAVRDKKSNPTPLM